MTGTGKKWPRNPRISCQRWKTGEGRATGKQGDYTKGMCVDEKMKNNVLVLTLRKGLGVHINFLLNKSRRQAQINDNLS